MNNLIRFLKDVKYDMAVPPLGLNYYEMTPEQARENFFWFMSKIPERMDYLRNRCATDMKISVDAIDYSPQSLIIVWKWFLKTARMEKTPKEELDIMKEQAKIFGESFISWYDFTVSTKFIIRDIGMYLGESWIRKYPQLYWYYFVKPKNEINAKQPIVKGFYLKTELGEGDMVLNPLQLADAAATNIFDKTQKETDLYDMYMHGVGMVPEPH